MISFKALTYYSRYQKNGSCAFPAGRFFCIDLAVIFSISMAFYGWNGKWYSRCNGICLACLENIIILTLFSSKWPGCFKGDHVMRRSRAFLSILSTNQLHLRNPWIVYIWLCDYHHLFLLLAAGDSLHISRRF